MFMEQLDATVLATALPTMARDFGVTAPGMSVALTSYLLSLAVFIPASGSVADRFGSRTVFRAAIAVFTLGSILCALAPTLGAFVAARLVQGLGGAMMMPVGRLVLLRSVARRDLVSAMSWLLVPALIGPILGPPFGGLVVTYFDWRWIFLVNVPVGLLGVVLAGLFIDEVRGEARRPFDLAGLALSGLALGTLFLGFELASHGGNGRAALALVAVGLAAGAAYGVHARRVAHPILDLSLMRLPSFRLSVVAGSLTRVAQGAQPFLLPLMLQVGFGMSAAQSGALTLASAGGSLTMKALAPRLLRRFGFRTSLVANGVLASGGSAACALLRPDWPGPALFGALAACGFLMSFQFTAYNTVAYAEVPASRMSAATSFYTTFQQLMLSVGICVAAGVLQGAMWVNGHAAPAFADFSAAFLAVSAVSLSATLWNLRFAPEAGSDISGHTPRGRKAAAPGTACGGRRSA
ncbi:MDR family MFS transporter [Methylobacterium crusticola]|nr:MDR family MFS transporter [Methylobacterium crusticola]